MSKPSASRKTRRKSDAAYADEPTVRYVQDALVRIGYDVGAEDGVVGARTGSAIEAYQRQAGLTADGALTDTLVRRLRNLGAGTQ